MGSEVSRSLHIAEKKANGWLISVFSGEAVPSLWEGAVKQK